MGVDCGIILPDNVRVDDVARVIGIAAGLKPQMEKNPLSTRVPGVDVTATSSVEMVQITIRSLGHLLVDGEDKHFVYYHLEGDEPGRSLNPRSTAFWIAIAHRLVDFFGGKIDYQDCDDIEVDYEKPARSWAENHASDGDEWDAFQERLFNVKPITVEEMQYLDSVAAYKISEMKGRGE